MHSVLQIQEILLNIFGQYRLEISTAGLLALAQTCRTFKEPALDVLWEILPDPSPLARCLPNASLCKQTLSPPGSKLTNLKCHSFSRSLTPNEWDILRSYTRRIRSMEDTVGISLDWESVSTFLNPPTTEPLFPNLRCLHCGCATASKMMLYMPFPSLVTLAVDFRHESNRDVFRCTLESFSKVSPNIRRLTVQMEWHDPKLGKFFSDCLCQWRNLQDVDCKFVTLSSEALAHLSRMAALTRLAFGLSATAADKTASSDSTLIFSNLHQLSLYSKSLELISQLLSRAQLPVITDLSAFVERCPSKLDVSCFWIAVQTSGIGNTIQGLVLEQTSLDKYVTGDPRLVLRPEDLRPCMAFSNLRRITFNVEWNVDLTSSQLLTCASMWPHLEAFAINTDWGWNTQGGITPDDLVQLLHTCRSLSYVALAINTRGYTEFHRSLASFELTLPPTFSINVVDSFMESESVQAIAAFLADFATRSDFSFRAWDGWAMADRGCMDLWHEAYRRAGAVPRHSRLFAYYSSRSF